MEKLAGNHCIKREVTISALDVFTLTSCNARDIQQNASAHNGRHRDNAGGGNARRVKQRKNNKSLARRRLGRVFLRVLLRAFAFARDMHGGAAA